MQIMPSTDAATARAVSQLGNLRRSVQVASKLINDLDSYLRAMCRTTRSGSKFVHRAYNVGIAYIYDAIRLAKKYGLDP